MLGDMLFYLGIMAVTVAVYTAFSHMQRKLRRLPPGPPGLPILGNLLQVGAKPNESLARLASKYGDIMCLSLGTKTAVVISSPAMAKEILKTNDRVCSERDIVHSATTFDHNKRSLIFGRQTPLWRFLRRVSNTELFSTRRLDQLLHLRRLQISLSIRQTLSLSQRRQALDVRSVVLNTSASLLGRLCFSNDMPERDTAEFEHFKKTIVLATESAAKPNLIDFFPILHFLDPQQVMRETKYYLREAYKIIERFIHHRMEVRKLSPDKGRVQNDLLDTLLDMLGEDFTTSDIRNFFIDIFSAGTDTSVITIEWAMSELMKNPENMKKAQRELDETVGKDRLIEEADLEKLPYLKAIIKETLRMHPPVPLLLPHRAEEDVQVKGYVVPKGTKILVNAWAIGRDPCVWKDPNVFEPERFLDASPMSNVDYKGQNYELIPFGTGRRICVGMPLASRMVPTLLGAIIHSFDWETPGGVDIDLSDKFGVTLHKTSPLIAIPSARLSSKAYEV